MGMSTTFLEMTEEERIEYRNLLNFVRARRQAFIECLDALSIIHERRLYRENYVSFSQFCLQELGMSRMQLNRLQRAGVNQERVQKYAPDVKSRLNTVSALNALEAVPNNRIREVVKAADSPDKHHGPTEVDILHAAEKLGVTNPYNPQPVSPDEEIELPTFAQAKKGFEKFTRYLPDVDSQADFIIERYPELAQAILERCREQ